LGGRELSYGSDLDLLFLFDDDQDNVDTYVRVAQRMMRLLSMPHGEGAGYSLDTRLRPSGNQGLLVVSLDSFARYHGVRDEVAAARDWERQALVKARPCTGSLEFRARIAEVLVASAYGRGAPDPHALVELRLRMEKELGSERLEGARGSEAPPPLGGRGSAASPGNRYNLKTGRGGLVDIEFATQWLQMKNGRDPRVRTTETLAGLTSLEACGYVDEATAALFREGYSFLRQLECALAVLYGSRPEWIEPGLPAVEQVARQLGFTGGKDRSAASSLLSRYVELTTDVRDAYLRTLGHGGEGRAATRGPT
jgi:glutamate-ammonia-ligase adenylyltransferase